ncbi:TPA: hypothetical protein NP585_003276 [Klebsiella pneumoniae]|jgi:uncharacterized membrane protein YqjE|uniref:hypothetical protein n=1 Tax=Klebsiella pneumoniae TaxID=573 RepID=UPI00115F6B23|nr:hypothetical protein [Klebsiella pneumoniae]HDS2595397.1 hypothetical protein [Klebsiella pneumoniae subsp. pneumoniae]MDG3468695.1 hypothetical protein [Klebsiella pneumoniae]MDS0189452.1 hypothetical protein [Klebsiella pneumoniae]MDS1045916.1 hypothetical protein [Klebsiella pneumoniae]MDS1064422.1 hypothetical protein [Klebsiella pneumoniae]
MTSNAELTPVIVERASEQLRQERETFDQAKKHDHWWFVLRLVMGFTSVILLISVMVVSVYILFKSTDFPSEVVTAAGASLFVDVLGMLIGVWKIALNPKSTSKLQPTTQSSIPDVL